MHTYKSEVTIGQIIESLRLYFGFSIRDLSIRSSISERTIRRIESEECLPRNSTCERLAHALYTDWEDIEKNYDIDRSTRVGVFKGGKQSKRDKEWSPFRDSQFRKWWHRIGKKEYGGHDIDSEESALAIYDEWENHHRNTTKLITNLPYPPRPRPLAHLTRH